MERKKKLEKQNNPATELAREFKFYQYNRKDQEDNCAL